MSALLLPFARHIPTGKTVAPEEVERGNACECECLFCGAPVQARHCNTKANHFAHQAKTVDDDNPCPACFERCIFWMTKRIFEEGSAIALPDYWVTYVDRQHGFQRRYPITEAQVHSYELIEFPRITTSDKDRIFIDLSINNHKLKLIMSYDDYLNTYRVPREASVHISLDYLKRVYKDQKKGFLLAMKALILESLDAKTWLFHSEERNALREGQFQEAVDKLREQRKTFQEAQQRESQLIAEKSGTWAIEKKARVKRASEVLARREVLLGLAMQAAQAGEEFGWQCASCFVVSSLASEQCVHCGSASFSVFDFSPENMESIRSKFDCGNYAGRSLDAAPRLVL